MPNGDQIVSASDIPIEGECHTAHLTKEPYETPRPLTTEEISEVVESYGKAAEYALEAGFDGVEVHGANGYLIDQFFQTVSNVRTDEYGGSLENRFRFCKSVIERVLQVFPPGRVGVRLSPNGLFNGMGSGDNFESFTYFAQQLNEFSLAYLHIMDGLAFGFHEKCPQMNLSDFKPLFSGQLIGNCGYTPESAEERLGEGDAAAIAFGRVTLSNPDLPARVQNGWPLAELAPMDTWYMPTEEIRGDPNIGYTTFPAYVADQE